MALGHGDGGDDRETARIIATMSPRERPPASAAGVWLALGAVYVIWSTTFVAIRVTNETVPPLVGAGLRFFVAGGSLLLLGLRSGDRLADRPTRRQWRSAGIVGLLLMFGGNGGIVWAERTIPSGVAGLVIATVPLWIAGLDRAVLGRRQPAIVVVGLVAGFAGAAILVGGSAIDGKIDIGGLLVAVAAAASWAVGSLVQRHAELPRRPFVSAGMQMLLASGAFAVAGALAGELGDLHPSRFSRASVLALGYLIVFGSWIGFTSYLWLLRVARTSLVATYAYVTPVGAVIVGRVLLDEALSTTALVAGALIVAAVALIISGGGLTREDGVTEDVLAEVPGASGVGEERRS